MTRKGDSIKTLKKPKKKPAKIKSKNYAVATDFFAYCVAHPEERFWQALRNWSSFNYIIGQRMTKDLVMTEGDTFDFEGKDK